MPLLATSLALLGLAASADVGEVAIIEDATGVIHSGTFLQTSFCKETAKAFFRTHSDTFDGLVTFSTKALSDVQGVAQGTPVKNSTQGIGLTTFDNSSAYGSSRLEQCVFMGSLGKLPESPDGQTTMMFGMPGGLTGVELVGHEYGHHWLVWILYDKGDGRGPQHLLRGWENGPNGHYNYHADSRSVMYGNFITDNGGGSFKLEGGVRKYNPLDQYLMGLREAPEVPPLFFIDDGSGQGSPAMPLAKGKSATASGIRVEVSIDDVVRAMGARAPSAASAPKCWRVAFVLVSEQFSQARPEQIAKVDAYRARLSEWFGFATDGRGVMDTRLAGSGCQAVGPDAGVTPDAGVADAGQADAGAPVEVDASVVSEDAGQVMEDGGECEGEVCVAPADGGRPPGKWDTYQGARGTLRPGCGCGAASGWAFLALATLTLALSRQRERGKSR